MEQQDRESTNFEEMVQRAVNAEAKVGLKSSTIVQDSDIHCSRNHRPSNSIVSKVQTQETSAKEPCPKQSRPKEAKPAKRKASALPRTNATESLEQEKKDKKDRQDKKRRFREKKERSDILATDNNAIDASKKKKKNRDRDTSKITCYNCNKKGHFANTCTEPKN